MSNSGARRGKLSDRAVSIIQTSGLSRRALAERFGITPERVDALRRVGRSTGEPSSGA